MSSPTVNLHLKQTVTQRAQTMSTGRNYYLHRGMFCVFRVIINNSNQLVSSLMHKEVDRCTHYVTDTLLRSATCYALTSATSQIIMYPDPNPNEKNLYFGPRIPNPNNK